MDKATADLVLQLHQEGKSTKEISRKIDCSTRSVIRYLDFIRFHGFDEFVDFYVNENKPQFTEKQLVKFADQTVKENLSFDRACIYFKVSQCKLFQELLDQRRPRISPQEKARIRFEAAEKQKKIDLEKLLFICEKDLHPFIENGLIFGSSDNENTRAIIAAHREFQEKVKSQNPATETNTPRVGSKKKSKSTAKELAHNKAVKIACPPPTPRVLFVASTFHFMVGVRDIFLACVIDCFNMEIVSYSISTQESLEAILLSVKQALPRFNLEAEPILHSIKTPLYQHPDFQAFLKEQGIKQSLSQSNNYYNACDQIAESVFASLKAEMSPDNGYPTVEALVANLVYKVDYFNARYPQVNLQNKSPLEYRDDYEQQIAAQSSD